MKLKNLAQNNGKLKIAIVSILGLFVVLCLAFTIKAVTASALSDNYRWSERGKKSVMGSTINTGFSGTAKSTFYFFGKDQQIYDGTSSSYWYGGSPYNADSITHTDIVGVGGIGSASFGVSASSSGAGVSIGVSTGNKSASYSYTVTNAWKININYTYKSSILLITSISQSTMAQFKFGSSFYVVDSEANKYTGSYSHWIS